MTCQHVIFLKYGGKKTFLFGRHVLVLCLSKIVILRLCNMPVNSHRFKSTDNFMCNNSKSCETVQETVCSFKRVSEPMVFHTDNNE